MHVAAANSQHNPDTRLVTKGHAIRVEKYNSWYMGKSQVTLDHKYNSW